MINTTHETAILKFLKVHTAHKTETAVIRKARANGWDYVVTIENGLGKIVKVHLFISGGDIGYGIAGWGVCTVASLKDYI